MEGSGSGAYGHAYGQHRGAPPRSQSAQDVHGQEARAYAVDSGAGAPGAPGATGRGNNGGTHMAATHAGSHAGATAAASAPLPPAEAAEKVREPQDSKYFYMDPQDAEANMYGPFTLVQYREWLGNLAPGGEQADNEEFCRFAKMLTWREGDPQSQKVYLMQTLDLPDEVQNAILTGQTVPPFDMARLGSGDGNGGRQAAAAAAPKATPEPADRVSELREAVAEIVRGVLQASEAWQVGQLSKQGFKDLCRRTVDKVVAEEQKHPEAMSADDSVAALVQKRRQDISTLTKQMLGHHMQTSPSPR